MKEITEASASVGLLLATAVLVLHQLSVYVYDEKLHFYKYAQSSTILFHRSCDHPTNDQLKACSDIISCTRALDFPVANSGNLAASGCKQLWHIVMSHNAAGFLYFKILL